MATLRLKDTDEKRIKDIQEAFKKNHKNISQTDILKSGIEVCEAISQNKFSYEAFVELVERITNKVVIVTGGKTNE